MARLINQIELLSSRAGEIGAAQSSNASPDESVVQSDVGRSPQNGNMAIEIVNDARAALVGIVTVTFLVLFLLAGGPPMLARMSAALAIDLQATHTLRVISAVRVEVSRYYSSIALMPGR